MPRTRVGVAAAAIAVGALLSGCAEVDATEHKAVPAVEVVDGADETAPKTVTLTADAVRRLELQTTVVADPTALPYSAVLYDKKGAPWVYASPKDRTFIRVPVVIQKVEGDTANLTQGPTVGIVVVTRAAIKLYGAETGVGGGH